MPHVLIPLDGSPLADAAVPIALDLEPRAITLLHVEGDEDRGSASGAFQGAEKHGLDPQRCRAIVRRGRPAEVIQAVAAEVGATLIAMSTHGRTGFNRLVLGSVAEEVVRASSTPVLLTRSGAPAPRMPVLGRPLVGYDGSERAWRAVEALALLGRERLGPVTLLSVFDVASIRPAEADAIMERLVAQQRDQLLRQARQAAERARGLGVTSSAMVREGRPSTVLLETAEQDGCTLLAVATHGRSGVTRWIFGSVAEELLHTSSVPLLVVR